MNIEISGVHHENKGAILMLEAIKARVGEALPRARLAVSADWPPEARLQHGLFATRSESPGIARAMEFAPYNAREAVGYIPERRIDVLLDASGFAYGDFWGVEKLQRRLTARLKRWKRPGRTAILLPQAVGPFASPGMGPAFADALHRLDLAFVRDRVSLEYARELTHEERKLHLAPDMTCLLKAPPARQNGAGAGKIAIVPNAKMLSSGNLAANERYISFLAKTIETAQGLDKQPFILVHEGQGDKDVAATVNQRLPLAVPIVTHASALETKAQIARCDAIVSSRFHALVSALSTGVPALAVGWSHKYGELLGDYGRSDWVVDLASADDPAVLSARFLHAVGDQSVIDSLRAHARAQEEIVTKMWDAIFTAIASGASSTNQAIAS